MPCTRTVIDNLRSGEAQCTRAFASLSHFHWADAPAQAHANNALEHCKTDYSTHMSVDVQLGILIENNTVFYETG